MLKILSLLLISLPLTAQGKVFQNSYVRFEMSSRWNCELHEKAWICRHKVPKSCQKNPGVKACLDSVKKSKEAIVIVSAQEKSSTDSLKTFANYLGEPKKRTLPNGTSTQSQVIHNKQVSISNETWGDAMHLSSEFPHYYTRYLVTIKGDIEVLVTFSAHKLFYTNYSNLFFRSIKSLKVTSDQLSKISRKEVGKPVLSRAVLLDDELENAMNGSSGQSEGDGFSQILFALAMILAAVGIYIWLKSKK